LYIITRHTLLKDKDQKNAVLCIFEPLFFIFEPLFFQIPCIYDDTPFCKASLKQNSRTESPSQGIYKKKSKKSRKFAIREWD